MKLLRIGDTGKEKPAALVSDTHYIDLSDVIGDFNEKFFAEGGLNRIAPIVAERSASARTIGLQGNRRGAPIARPHQIVWVGLNYSDHAAESGMEVPSEPILFTKSPNTLVGPDDDVITPLGTTKLGCELELGIVIGSRASYLNSPEAARDHIAGWVVVNDVSERAFQLERGGEWLKGKSAETFNPAGPWLVTQDEGLDVSDLNGTRRQTGSTSTMVFDLFFLVHYISQFLVLEPGDLINTGTPRASASA